MTETDIANRAAAKIGGFGDQATGSGIIASIDDPDKVSAWCKQLMPSCRRKAIIDLASSKAPFRETVKYADLGAALTSYPEIGSWDYAFNLPGDCLSVVRQISQDFVPAIDIYEYLFEQIVSTTGNSKILLTNDLTNTDEDSAFIQYVIDQTNTNMFSEVLAECIATLLAAELCPILGKDLKTRQQMLLEYKTVCVPDARKYNQSQMCLETQNTNEDYRGGRNETLESV